MQIQVQEYVVRVQIITLSERLDATHAGALRTEQERLLNEGAAKFVVDLSALTFMDSAGMATLVSLLKRARQAQGDVILVKPTDPAAYRILSLTRFDQVFRMTDSVEAACHLL